jgi:hypothetical protein
MPAAIASSQTQSIVMPPVHLAILMVQRGTIIIPDAAGIPVGEPMPIAPPIAGVDMPGIPIIPGRSTIIVAIGCASVLP